jgi:MATE family multidrug resistance protein
MNYHGKEGDTHFNGTHIDSPTTSNTKEQSELSIESRIISDTPQADYKFPLHNSRSSLDNRYNSRRVFNKQLSCIHEARTSLEDDQDPNDEKITRDNILSRILVMIISSSFVLLCIFLMETTNLIFMGKTVRSSLNVSAIGLGNIYLNFIGVLIGFGILGGLDTMGSNAYGSYMYEKLGIYTIRSRIILFFIFIVITLPFGLCSHFILDFLGIETNLALVSSTYIKYMLPTVLLTFNFNLNMRYLQVMHIYFIPALITMSSLIFHIIFCYFFITLCEDDVMGVCYASTLTMSYNLIVSTGYIYFTDPLPKSLFIIPPSSTFNYEDFFEYIKLSFYSGVQHYGDYIGYEVVCLMCSYLVETSLAATLVVLNFANLIGYIYVGFSFPLSHIVGYFLGKRDYTMYNYTIKLFFWINSMLAVFLVTFTYFFADNISYFYISSEETAVKASEIIVMWTVGCLCDIYNIMFQAILRGAGKQKVTSIWNLVMSIFWMIPVCYLLCFGLGYDVLGIWFGCISYVMILSFVNFCYFIFLDEKKAAEEVRSQLKAEDSFVSYVRLGDDERSTESYNN